MNFFICSFTDADADASEKFGILKSNLQASILVI